MTSDLKLLFESEDGDLTIKSDDPTFNILLVIIIKSRVFYFNKYPENIVNTLNEFQDTSSHLEYFKLEDYPGFIQKRGTGYRIHLEMVNSDLTGNDLFSITKTIGDYFQVQSG